MRQRLVLSCLLLLTMLLFIACGAKTVLLEPEVASPAPVAMAEMQSRMTMATGVPVRSITAGPRFNTEQYDHIEENRFKEVLSNPLSTFSIDVDTASYANVRRFLSDNMLPPAGAVRIEELINYFSYDYPPPSDKAPFSFTAEMIDCPWQTAHKLVQLGIKGREIPAADLPPANLVFLLDVSGSMSSPDKLPLLKKGFHLLIRQLRPQDRVAIVVYAGAAGLVLPATPGDRAPLILAALDQLEAGGSTAGGDGIQLAYQVAKENFVKGGTNRVILATDGDFNVGASSDDEMVRLIEEKRASGIFLTVLGFGAGNLKDAKMEKLADKGNGNYAYIDNLLEAKKVLAKELGATLVTIAKDVKIQVEFNPAKVKAYRLVGYENRLLAREDFDDDRKDAGELGAGHTVTALYEIIPATAADASGADSLKYQKSDITEAAKRSPELMTVKLRYKEPDSDTSQLLVHPLSLTSQPLTSASNNIRFAAAVAQFGMLLRDSSFKGTSSYPGLIRLARDSRGEDHEGLRAEFIHLVERAELLSADQAGR